MIEEDTTIPGEGETRTRREVREVRERRKCDYHGCEDLATCRVSYLLKNARSNPLSSGYQEDNITWCSDGDAYSCEHHQRQFESDSARTGMEYCGTFYIKGYPHMFLVWVAQ